MSSLFSFGWISRRVLHTYKGVKTRKLRCSATFHLLFHQVLHWQWAVMHMQKGPQLSYPWIYFKALQKRVSYPYAHPCVHCCSVVEQGLSVGISTLDMSSACHDPGCLCHSACLCSQFRGKIQFITYFIFWGCIIRKLLLILLCLLALDLGGCDDFLWWA